MSPPHRETAPPGEGAASKNNAAQSYSEARTLRTRLSLPTVESERADAFHAGYPVPPHRGWRRCPVCLTRWRREGAA